MVKLMRYHSEIKVRRPSGELARIEVDLDDWYSDEEVVLKVAEVCGGRTAGDLVLAVERGELAFNNNGVVSCRIGSITVMTQVDGAVLDWGAPVGS